MVDIITESRRALKRVDQAQIDRTIDALRKAERIFCVGNGGGYAHAQHFASDLRKIARKQAFSFDNVAEMTARINDDGWENAWWDWMVAHAPTSSDLRFIFSVGGATGHKVSRNLHNVSPAYGIVGANGWDNDERIVIPSTSTPVVEGCQSVIAHHIVEMLR